MTRRQANYALFILTAGFTLNYFDRSIITVLLDLIKKDLALSDTGLGLIAGFGFSLVYAVFGIPLARLADITSRKAVIAAGMVLWSVMTALGGFARTGTELAWARVGVGLGEAAGTSASHAMLSEHFPKEERPRVLSILNLGAPIGIFLGVIIGGWVGQRHGWRSALFVAGLPGLVIAALLFFFAAERKNTEPPSAADEGGSLWSSLKFLASQRSYRYTIVATFFSGFTVNALFIWMPTFFGRVHHMPPAEIGTWVGGLMGVSGFLGVYAGGAVVTRFGGMDDRWKAAEPAFVCLASLPFLLCMLFVDSEVTALALLAVGSFLLQAILGPLYSIYQVVSPPRMRAVATSVHNLVGSLGGVGLGSLIIGALSDHWTAVHHELAIRFALLPSFLCAVPAAAFYVAAMRSIREDIARVA